MLALGQFRSSGCEGDTQTEPNEVRNIRPVGATEGPPWWDTWLWLESKPFILATLAELFPVCSPLAVRFEILRGVSWTYQHEPCQQRCWAQRRNITAPRT